MVARTGRTPKKTVPVTPTIPNPKAPKIVLNSKGETHVGNVVNKQIPTSAAGYKTRKCDMCKNAFTGGEDILELKKQFKSYYGNSTTGTMVIHKTCMEFFLWPDTDLEEIRLSFKEKRERQISEDFDRIRQQYIDAGLELLPGE